MLKSKIIQIILLSIFFCQPVVQGQWVQSPVIDQGFISAITIKDSVIFLGGSNLSDSAVSYFYSKDYGDSWTECFNTITVGGGIPRSIVITDTYIFIAEGGGESGCIFRTSDWGLHWEECFGLEFGYPDPRCLIYYAGALYAGTFSDCGGNYVVKSSDNGDTWTVIWNDGTVDSRGILSIVVVDSLILVGTGNAGVYGSSDYGNTWTERNNGLPPNSNVRSMVLFDNRIFITNSSGDGGVFYSTDYGLNWQTLNDGLDTKYYIDGLDTTSYIRVRNLVKNNDYLFADTDTKVYVLLEQEMRWMDISGDLPDSLYNYSMAVCDDNLFLGTGLNGLWYRSISGLTEVKKETETPTIFSLSQNYPNPFNPTTTFQYALKDEAAVTIKIYNILGKEIITLVNETQPAGYQSITWNGTDHSGNPVPSGIYICQMNAGNFTKSQKMVLMK